jgi:methyl-accepting chemotaxis protein
MPRRKKPEPQDAWRAVTEDVRAQLVVFADGLNSGLREVRQEIHELRTGFDVRLVALETVVRKNSADIQQNSADIRQNTADIRQNSADIKQNSADIKQNSADIKQNSADIRQNTADIRQNSADIQTLIGRVDELGSLEGRVSALERNRS